MQYYQYIVKSTIINEFLLTSLFFKLNLPFNLFNYLSFITFEIKFFSILSFFQCGFVYPWFDDFFGNLCQFQCALVHSLYLFRLSSTLNLINFWALLIFRILCPSWLGKRHSLCFSRSWGGSLELYSRQWWI